jgi:hypothetical protein
MLPFLLLGVATVLGDPASSRLHGLFVVGPPHTFATWAWARTVRRQCSSSAVTATIGVVVNRRGGTLALYIALGAGAGTAIGVAIGNLAIGIGVGVAIGVALGLALQNRTRR